MEFDFICLFSNIYFSCYLCVGRNLGCWQLTVLYLEVAISFDELSCLQDMQVILYSLNVILILGGDYDEVRL